MKIPALANYENALRFRAQRSQVLAANIANADTPGYKARDLDFGAALSTARQQPLVMKQTSNLHQQASGTSLDNVRTVYRTSEQPTLDGNTVAVDVEQSAFAENALQYRTSLSFLDGSIRTLRLAIKGTE